MTDKTSHPPTNSQCLHLDWEVYAQALDASDLSEDEKREMVEIMWNIVVSFVDMGFGVHPVQQVCEQSLSLTALKDSDVVSSSHNHSKSEFNKTAKSRTITIDIETVLGAYLKGDHHVQPPA